MQRELFVTHYRRTGRGVTGAFDRTVRMISPRDRKLFGRPAWLSLAWGVSSTCCDTMRDATRSVACTAHARNRRVASRRYVIKPGSYQRILFDGFFYTCVSEQTWHKSYNKDIPVKIIWKHTIMFNQLPWLTKDALRRILFSVLCDIQLRSEVKKHDVSNPISPLRVDFSRYGLTHGLANQN